MRFYLLRSDGTVSDAGEYPEQPPARPDGEWQAGSPPQGSQEIQPLLEKLRVVFESELPPESQADLAPLKAAVKMELEQGRPAIARLIIQRASVPDGLASIKDALLALFDAALVAASTEATPKT